MGSGLSLDTGVPNRVVRRALVGGGWPEFAGCDTVRTRVCTLDAAGWISSLAGASGLLPAPGQVGRTRGRTDAGSFPSAASERASRHLRELDPRRRRRLSGGGLCSCVQRQDARQRGASTKRPDPQFISANSAGQGRRCGVELLARALSSCNPPGIELGAPHPASKPHGPSCDPTTTAQTSRPASSASA